MARKHPTIRDVARFANVSTATVSRTLSKPSKVSPDTRKIVAAAVQATGYAVNQAARSLRRRHTRTILVALPNIGNTFFSVILDAIERTASARGYEVLISNRFEGADADNWVHNYFQSRRVDGLVLLDGAVDIGPLRHMFADSAVMPIVVACEDIGDKTLSVVESDNCGGARAATAHLLALGHTRIAHLAAPRENTFFAERSKGYLDALISSGVPPRPEFVVSGDFSLESGVAAAHKLMALDAPPTAVCCASDEMAIGFISGLRDLGMTCPGDVSVVGFDDIAVAAHAWPPLTTIFQQREEIGRSAATALLDILEGEAEEHQPVHLVLETKLIERASTAPPVPSGR